MKSFDSIFLHAVYFDVRELLEGPGDVNLFENLVLLDDFGAVAVLGFL